MTSTAPPLTDRYPGLVAPRFATPRDPGRRTLGAAVAKVADELGTPLMPWQRLVADVAGELDEEGMFAYPLVVVTVQRQAGKTRLDLAQSVQRCLMGPGRKVWHTAQTGQEARKKWGELVDDITTSPLAKYVKGKPKRAAGSEVITFINGSQLRPHPPTRDGLHGEQSDTNNVDEAWAFDEAQGADLFQAITPTQATREKLRGQRPQTFIWSTAGDRSSTWFRGLVNRGRRGEEGLAYFEWSIPDDADPMDPQVIADAHPALGFTQTLGSFRAAKVSLGDKPGEYARAYGNRWTGSAERIIPAEPWLAAQTEADLPAGAPTIAVAVGEDGDSLWAAVLAAVTDRAGRVWWEVLAHRPGRSWASGYVQQLRRAGSLPEGQAVAIDRRGPAGPVADDLERGDEANGVANIAVQSPTLAEYAAACQATYDRIVHTETDDQGRKRAAPRLLHRRHQGLDDAADVAGKRGVGDGGWVFSRTQATGDTCPLEAGVLATWLALSTPAPREMTEDSMGFA